MILRDTTQRIFMLINYIIRIYFLVSLQFNVRIYFESTKAIHTITFRYFNQFTKLVSFFGRLPFLIEKKFLSIGYPYYP